MRESIHASRCDFLSHQGTQERADQVAVSPVLLAFSLVFTAYLSNAVVSGKSPNNFSGSGSYEAVGIAHSPPRSL